MTVSDQIGVEYFTDQLEASVGCMEDDEEARVQSEDLGWDLPSELIGGGVGRLMEGW